MNTSIFLRLSKFFLLMLASTALWAQSLTPPDKFMYEATHAVLQDLEFLKPEDTQRVNQLIDSKIMPHVDVDYMVRWVAGRKAWTQSTEAQKAEFRDVFTRLMIHTYASTLFMIRDKEISYSRPPKIDYLKAKTVPVSSEIRQQGKEPIHIIYQLRLVSKEWKIFDLLIEGVSLLKGFQTQYEEIIAQKGLPGAISAMQSRLSAD